MHRYNGVDLPDKPQYDEAASPCAMIVLLPHGYVFEVLNVPMRQGAVLGEVSAANVTYSNWNLSADGKSWEVGAQSITAERHSYSLADILWTSRDITDAEGDVLKAASTPIWLMDMYSFKLGLALALALPPRPLAPVKEPIGYLYGHIAKEGEKATHAIDGVGYVGAVLPKLPEWDKEGYPYACIGYNTAGGDVLLAVSESPFKYNGTVFGVYCSKKYIYLTNGKWDALWLNFNMPIYFDGGAFWTSHDILNEDGSIYLDDADCVCIPIYE